MLTKSMLQYRLNGSKVRPLLLTPDELTEPVVTCVNALEAGLQKAEGRRKQDVLAEFQEHTGSLRKTGAGLAKIAGDLVEAGALSEGAEEFRWQVLNYAETHRREYLTLDEFHADLRQQFGDKWRERMFSDLEPRLEITKVKPIRTSLIDRYNIAQIQGLIMISDKIRCTLSGVSLSELRALLRSAKFFQVLLEIEIWDGETCVFSLAGPLSLFQQQQAYGVKLASFFPIILHFSKWKLEAEMTIKNRARKLKLDETLGLKSHYRPPQGYVPDEFSQIEELIVQKLPTWTKLQCPEPVLLGDDHLVVPDITLRDQSGNSIHIEFFHKWHQGQLSKRLDFLAKRSNFRFVLVVPRELMKQLETRAEDLNDTRGNVKVVEFAKTPSVRKVADAVILATASS